MARRGLQAAARLGGLMLAGAGFVSVACPAMAQIPQLGNVQGLTGAPSFGQTPPNTTTIARPPPVGLPGASPKAAPAPATQPPATMNPTDALFDAINRGDLAVAQDAISRGADLNGANVLGMTPVQLSIDLGRNDITFLLLSAGGGAASNAVTEPAHARPTVKSAGNGQPTRTAERRPARVVHTAATAPAPAQTPRLFAGDGGAPIPSVGFLGFDSAR